jgi:glutamine phosphoribosylpyrophosphate amidotransferase
MLILDKDRCAFNIIYTIDGSHSIDSEFVSVIRKKIALHFAVKIMEKNESYDYVVPIPNTGKLYSRYIAKFIKARHLNIFKKVTNKRTLGLDDELRSQFYNLELDVINSPPKDSRILFVDEALISGLTTLKIGAQAKKMGIKSYAFGYMSPPINGYCPWGNIKNTDRYFDSICEKGLIENKIEELRLKVGAESIHFMDTSEFLNPLNRDKTCILCMMQN